jgi:AcrR family transcriptional regulator
MARTDTMDSRQDARAAIVEAASRLLRERGAQAVTTRAVAQAAGVQAPAIYRLFGDKDGLIEAVAESVMSTYVTGKAEPDAVVEDDPVAELRAAWHRHIDFGLQNPELFTLLASPARARRSPATAAGLEVLRARIGRIAAAGRLRVDEQRALAMVHGAGTGTILTMLATSPDRRDGGLPSAMFDAVRDAIVSGNPATGDNAVSTVAVTFLSALQQLPALTDAERTLMAEWVARSLARLIPR